MIKNLKKIILIDINILKQIKMKNKNILRKIDRQGYLISIWLPLYESILFHQDVNKVKESLNENLRILNKYLKKATNDVQFFLNLLPNLFNAIINDDNLNNYISYLENVNEIIIHQHSPKNICHKIEELAKIAQTYNIQYTHPLFITTLSILLGNKIYRKILKPKQKINKKNIINAVSDILSLSRTEFIKTIVKKNQTIYTTPLVKFYTLDKSLNQFLNEFKITSSKHIENQTIIEINISINIFPLLKQKDIDDKIKQDIILKLNSLNLKLN